MVDNSVVFKLRGIIGSSDLAFDGSRGFAALRYVNHLNLSRPGS